MYNTAARPHFPFENNPEWIRSLFVPDPLSAANWQDAVTQWQSPPHDSAQVESFAGLLIRCGYITVTDWGAIMALATGAMFISDPHWLAPSQCTPEEKVLLHEGYVLFNTTDGGAYFSGGKLPPTMTVEPSGPNSGQRIWAIVPPVIHNLAVPTAKTHDAGDKAENPAAHNSATEAQLAQQLQLLIENQCIGSGRDLHFESDANSCTLRCYNGSCRENLFTWPAEEGQRIARILKRWSNLSTAGNALPQDGRFLLNGASGKFDLRISVLPTVTGESIVLRLLGSDEKDFSLNDLAIPAPLLSAMHRFLEYGQGLLLCTGPTASGKTTTLVTLLNEACQQDRKLLSIEDPVEKLIPAACQSQVDPTRGWTFDAALRAFLRHDPDIIFVGEIRDRETAHVACRAALTGHAVLATLHAATECAALARLQAWQIAPSILAEVVRLIINQRLNYCALAQRHTAQYGWWQPNGQEIYHNLSSHTAPPVSETYQPLFAKSA